MKPALWGWSMAIGVLLIAGGAYYYLKAQPERCAVPKFGPPPSENFGVDMRPILPYIAATSTGCPLSSVALAAAPCVEYPARRSRSRGRR